MTPVARERMNPRQSVRLTQEVRLTQMVLRRVEKALIDEGEDIEVRIIDVKKREMLFSDAHFCMSNASATVEIDHDRVNSFSVIIAYDNRKGFMPFGAIADSLASEILDKIGTYLEPSED